MRDYRGSPFQERVVVVDQQRRAEVLGTLGSVILRYGLVVLILWFGVFKFTAAEARSIEPLVANSPLLSWLYRVTDVRGASN
ncbi:MAG: DUF417 family protein, partial [Gemmatimonadales bacterium]